MHSDCSAMSNFLFTTCFVTTTNGGASIRPFGELIVSQGFSENRRSNSFTISEKEKITDRDLLRREHAIAKGNARLKCSAKVWLELLRRRVSAAA